jgi:hypothetical protein
MTADGRPHLSAESLLLILSDELPASERQSAFDHLASCRECCQRMEETGTVVGELQQAVQKEDFDRFSARLASVPAPAGLLPRLARFSVTAASAAAALTVGLFIWNSSTPPVSATELLDRAVREESQQTKRAVRVRVRDAGGVCAVSSEILPVAQAGPSCERIRSRLAGGNWDWRNPLSAQGFQRWRSSLRDRHDTVTEEPGVFKLRTSTSRGELRAATLQVRTSDFHSMTMRLEFAESATIEIAEDSSPETTAEVAPELAASFKPTVTTPLAPASPPQKADLAEQLDSAEIQVRVALHERQADRGYETIIRRGPDGLEVFGLVRGSERQEELTAALAAIPDVRVRIKNYAEFQPGDDASFPSGEQGNTLPPLAGKWLKSTWPEQEQSAAFVNQAGQLSSALLGEATVVQELTLRCDTLGGNPAVVELLRVRKDHERRISELLSSLRASLEPIAGPLGQPSAATIEQARTLQSAITRLFSASGPGSGSLEYEIGRLRFVFGAAK